ncbi:MAG TPA: response regulator [Chryseosolibacter sp.]
MENHIPVLLLIEDDPDDAELTIFTLRKYNLVNPIVHIDDGEKALDFLFGSDENPALILLDLKMPRIDGIHILKKLKGDPQKKGIPVIALISSKEGKNYVKSFDVEADGYIVKPVDQKQFFGAVSEMGIASRILTAP